MKTQRTHRNGNVSAHYLSGTTHDFAIKSRPGAHYSNDKQTADIRIDMSLNMARAICSVVVEHRRLQRTAYPAWAPTSIDLHGFDRALEAVIHYLEDKEAIQHEER